MKAKNSVRVVVLLLTAFVLLVMHAAAAQPVEVRVNALFIGRKRDYQDTQKKRL